MTETPIKPKWKIPQITFAIVIFLLFIFTAASTNLSAPLQQPTPVPTTQSVDKPGSAPTLDPEYFQTEDQTNGIVIGAVILVLIIIGGTLSVILRKPPKSIDLHSKNTRLP